MYTVLVKDDNTLVTTVKKNIMHRSSMVDGFRVLVNPTYGAEKLDMRTFQCVIEYKLPISNTYTPEVLTPLDELYNGKLDYRLPIDTKITSETGDVEYKLIFVKADMDSDGKVIERVRKTASNTLNVIPVAMWSDYIADAKLDSLAQVLLMNQAVANQLGAYADMLNMTKADSIAKDEETHEFYLTANGKEIGNRVKECGNLSDEHGVPVVEFSAGTVKPDTPDLPTDENGEIDNVVEFNDSLMDDGDFDNVVEF